MDFHCLTRRDLQALCKKNRIPANMTNVAMADALKALQTVEGIEDIQQHTEDIQTPARAPAKAGPQIPDVSKSCRRSTRRNLVPPTEGESKDVQENSQSITRTRGRTATKASAFASRRKILEEEEEPEQESQESSKILEEQTESDMPETPIARNVGRKRATATSVPRNAETETCQQKRTDTPAVVALGARTGSRRSTRLMASEKKLFEELPSTRKCRGRKETIKISDALSEESEVFEKKPDETLDKSESIDSINGPSESHSSEVPGEKDEAGEDDQQGVSVTDSASSAEVTDEVGVFSVEITAKAVAAVSETCVMPETSLDQVEGSISETFENVQEIVSESSMPPETEEKCVEMLSYEKNSEAEVEGDDVLLATGVANDIPAVVQDPSLSMKGENSSETPDAENEKPVANQTEELTSDGSHALKAEGSVPVREERNLDQDRDNELTSVEVVNETSSYAETSKFELPGGEPDDNFNPDNAPTLLIREDNTEPGDMSSESDELSEDADEEDRESSISSLAEVDIAEFEPEAGLEDADLNNPETNLFHGEVSVDVLSESDEDTELQPLPADISLPNQKNPAEGEAPEDSENPCAGVKADERTPVENQNITLQDRESSVYTNFVCDLAEALTPLRGVVQTSSTVSSRIQVISPPRKAITPNSGGSLLRRISSAKKGTPIKSSGKKKVLEPDNKENNSEQSITREPIKMEKLGLRMVEKVKVNKKGLELLDGKSLRQLKRMVKEANTAEVGRKSAALQPLNENSLCARNN
ncbi:uncharacterized protein [Aristolochia californica]|uniref:uncharacterized protein n=1 Tax=Aristolochia californica TaxID=171875 RepID=UPI0035D61E7D